MKKREEEYWSYSLSEVNLELDNNSIFSINSSERADLPAQQKAKSSFDQEAKSKRLG
jgi:hypothetical protein